VPAHCVRKRPLSRMPDDPPMATRQRPGDIASAEARRQVQDIGRDIRNARIALGVSIGRAARSVGLSPSQHGRIERGELRRPTVDHLARAARAVGLDLSLKAYPSDVAVRDRGQLAALGRFEAMLGGPLKLHREVALPVAGDRRAWDGTVAGGDRPARVECEVRLHDIQGLERRFALKQRDDPQAGVVLLVVARTRHNAAVLAEHRAALRQRFPADGPSIAAELRAGRVPRESGIVVV
jgi:transcriptional regulator with XRE-family HTH domain